MADLAEIAQSGIDPVTGSPLSAERRKALFRRSQISSSSVFGGGGALVPVSRGPDPETLSIVNTNTSAIASLQKQVNDLAAKDTQILVAVSQITALQNQINTVQSSISDLSNSLQQISNLIAENSALEQQKERLSQQQEKNAAETGLRRGKESLLERKIQSALVEPVKQIGNKVQSSFDNLLNLMWQLLGGWLTIQGLNVLQAYARDDKKKLEDIKNNVIKGLTVVGGILGVLNIGIFGVISSIANLSWRINKFIFDNTIGRLFKGIFDITKQALGFGEKAALGGAATVTMGAGTAEEIAKLTGKGATGVESRVAGAALKTGAGIGTKFLGGLVPFAGGVIETNSAIESFQRGNPLAGSLHSISAGLSFSELAGISIPFAWTAGLITSGLAYGADITGIGQTEQEQTPSTRPETKGIPHRNPINISTTTPTPEPTPTLTPTPAQTSAPTLNAKITPAQTSRVQTVPFNLGPEPEPRPNIVYASSGNNQTQQSPQSSLDSGSATDVPLISSSDPDNFYTLYSQVHYNVIM
jgi:regulator of replication initiation timing